MYVSDSYHVAPLVMPLVRRPGGQGNNRQNIHKEEHHEEERQDGGGEKSNDNQGGIGALMPFLQEIIVQLGPRVQGNQHDHGQDEGSHHGDSHMSGRGEDEEYDCEHSHTPLGGREYH